MSNKLAIVGGTGAVGRVFIEYLKTHELPIDEIKIVASSRSAGKSIHLNGADLIVEDIECFDFSLVNFAFFSAGSEVARKFAPIAKKSGCTNSQLIHSQSEIPFDLVENSKTIGISSGASAPDILVDNFLDELRKRFTVSIDEIEIIKEDVVFKVPKKLN